MHFVDEVRDQGHRRQRRRRLHPPSAAKSSCRSADPQAATVARAATSSSRRTSATRRCSTCSYRRVLRAESGENGRGKDQYGKGGEDLVIQVPPGTQVYDDDTGELLVRPRSRPACASWSPRAGAADAATSTSRPRSTRRPTQAEKGEPGEQRNLRLELKLLADVGLLGFPNVGKSTFIARGVARATEDRRLPVHDAGAQPGRGLAGRRAQLRDRRHPRHHRGRRRAVRASACTFLRHVERTRVLLHIAHLRPRSGARAAQGLRRADARARPPSTPSWPSAR